MKHCGSFAAAVGLVLSCVLTVQAQSPATARQLTFGTLDAKEGDWSPDGKWVVFQRDSETYGNGNIWKVNIAGTKEVQLTKNYYCDSKPRWSVKGKIVFQRNEDRETKDLPGSDVSSIWMMNSDGSSQTRMVKYRPNDEGGASWPTWNPAGTLIAFDYGSADGKEVWWIKKDKTGLKKIAGADFGASPHGKDKSWKPAGPGANLTLVISLTQPGESEYWHLARVGSYYKQSWMYDIEVDQCQFVPCYSPDGSRILYKDDETGDGDIWVMNDGGMGKVRLTDSDSTGYCSTTPTWFPDGRYIAYWSEEDASSSKAIWIMTFDGTHKVCVMNEGSEADDHEALLRISRDGSRILFNRADDGGTDQVFVLDLDTGDDDGDGLKNWQEDVWGTDRAVADTNGDGIKDGASVKIGVDPS